jgi:hypothetical protein
MKPAFLWRIYLHMEGSMNCIFITECRAYHRVQEMWLGNLYIVCRTVLDLVMTHVASRRAITVEAQVQSHAIAWGICGGQSGTGQGFSPSFSVFPYQYHPTNAVCPLIYSFVHQSLAVCNLSSWQCYTNLPSLLSFCSFGLCCKVSRTIIVYSDWYRLFRDSNLARIQYSVEVLLLTVPLLV